MIFNRFVLPILSVFIMVSLYGCSQSSEKFDPSLSDLDRVIADREIYRKAKEDSIAVLNRRYREAQTPGEQFQVLGRLLDEYRAYNSDSAFAICRRREEMARLTGNPDDSIHARLNKADMMLRTTMYIETLEIVEPLNSSDIPDYLASYLYHIKRTLYGLLADYSLSPASKSKYEALTEIYRDSLLLANDPNSIVYHIIKCDALNVHGRYSEAIAELDSLVGTGSYSRDGAISAFTLSNSYHGLGDTPNEKQQLIISSINDLKSSIKEYISLRSLALLLYQEGDIEHAYKYLRICMEDAQECNARQRQLEINSIFQVVNDVYLDTIERQKSRIRLSLVAVCLLSVLLIVAICLIRKQMAKVSRERRTVEDMNRRLSALNDELKDTNTKLLDANRSIAENSYLKEEYIARYMDQCLVYIDRLDSFRKNINKLAMAGRTDEIKKQTKSIASIDSELKSFYDNFDETFLRLFPTFVADFNALLRPEERIEPKGDGKLNTELRIFALIRLGINDSVRIAQFLRYSVTTIYNYRTRVRNKAQGNRDELETELMKIGRFGNSRK